MLDKHKRIKLYWLGFLLCVAAPLRAQLPAAPIAPATTPPPRENGAAPAGTPLSRKQAESLALRNNPQITVGKLRALEAAQYVREQRAALLPTAYLSLTA